MKKIILALLVAVTFTSANAQPKSWLIYGNIGFMSETDPAETKWTNFNITPGVGYQLNKDWTVGINLNYGMEKVEPTGGTATTDNTMMSFGPFARYTHWMGSMFYCFGQLDAMYNSNKSNLTGGATVSGMGLMVWPAIGMAIGKGWALNVSMGGLGFSSMKSDVSGAKSDTKINFNFGVQNMMIGLSYNLIPHGMKGHHENDDTRKMDDDKKGKKSDDE